MKKFDELRRRNQFGGFAGWPVRGILHRNEEERIHAFLWDPYRARLRHKRNGKRLVFSPRA